VNATHLKLLIPLSLSLVMAWTDIQRKRIPNYLTLGSALAGLGFQLGFYGLSGMMDGLMGLGLGFALLICFYWLGGLGAGDVKALAALGAWLGPRQTVDLFIYMALSGLGVMIFFLWRRGLLLSQIKLLGAILMNWVLLRPTSGRFPSPSAAPRTSMSEGIPYAVSLALGMAILCYRNYTG
jgi:prepilin peptidase CpaA